MRAPGFVGPAYSLRSKDQECQTCINLYPEINELQTAKNGEIGALIGTPGLTSRVTQVTSPGRGVYVASTGQLFHVAGSVVYEVESDYTSTAMDTTLNTSTGSLSFADNGTQMMITDGAHGYIANMDTLELVEITDADFEGFGQVTYQDGFFIAQIPNSGRVQLSSLIDGTTWDALDFATAETIADNLTGCLSDHRILWLPGEQTIEPWQHTGVGDFPFDRIPGGAIAYGCVSGKTFIQMANTVIWLGGGNGHGIVWSATGLEPQRISNYGVEHALKGYGDLSGATAWTYTDSGHSFYCLHIPGSGTTWAYDAAVGQWHERKSLDSTGALGRHRATSHAFAFGKHFVDDYATGDLYTLDDDVYTDNGSAIIAERTSPHMAAGRDTLVFGSFLLDMETGVGIDGSGQGSDPKAMLQYSDDGGHTWSSELWASIGKIGDRKAVVEWNRLGASNDRVWRVRISDPVKRVILGADVNVTKGR